MSEYEIESQGVVFSPEQLLEMSKRVGAGVYVSYRRYYTSFQGRRYLKDPELKMVVVPGLLAAPVEGVAEPADDA